MHLASLCVALILADAISLKDLYQQAIGAAADATFAVAVIKGLLPVLGEGKTREVCHDAKLDLLRLPPVDTRAEIDQRAFLATNGLEFLYPVLTAKEKLAALLETYIKSEANLSASARALAKALKVWICTRKVEEDVLLDRGKTVGVLYLHCINESMLAILFISLLCVA